MSLRCFGNELHNRAQILLLHFLEGIVPGFCLLDTEKHTVFHVLDVFWFLFCAQLYHQYLAPYAVSSSKYKQLYNVHGVSGESAI